MTSLHSASRAAGSGIFLGASPGGWAWAGAERSTLVLGPSRSGKTSSLVVPNVLAAPGAVVSTSTKPDVMHRTAAARLAVGRTMLYDPSNTIAAPPGVERVGWSPVPASRRWDAALVTAASMVRSARGAFAAAPVIGGHEHWTERAASLLAPLLHAAAVQGEPMATVLHWVDRHDGAPALDVLATEVGEAAPATDLLSGILATDSREQSSIWSTASGVLAAYRWTSALASTTGPLLDPVKFCAGPNTLYVAADHVHQEPLAPLVVGLIGDVRDAAYRRAGHDVAAGAPVAPVLLALDEVANIAPLPDLPSMVSEGGGQGLLTLACLQDLSQARMRWGRVADSFFSLFGTSVVLPGVANTETLEALSLLGGEAEVLTRTVGVSEGPASRLLASASTSTVWRRVLAPSVIGHGIAGAALTVDARNRMGWVQLTPAHGAWPWRDLSTARPLDRSRPPDRPRPGGRSRRADRAAPPTLPGMPPPPNLHRGGRDR